MNIHFLFYYSPWRILKLFNSCVCCLQDRYSSGALKIQAHFEMYRELDIVLVKTYALAFRSYRYPSKLGLSKHKLSHIISFFRLMTNKILHTYVPTGKHSFKLKDLTELSCLPKDTTTNQPSCKQLCYHYLYFPSGKTLHYPYFPLIKHR